MAKLAYTAVVAFAAAFIFNAAPASAEIDLKAGCDGKWVERAGSGFETYKVCERQTAASPKLGALHMRARHSKRLAHARLHRRLAARPVAHFAPVVVAAAAPAPRREAECVNLNCPQFILVGIGY